MSLATRLVGAGLAAALAATAPGSALGQPQRLRPELVAQIAALRAEKAARTAIQRKLSSRLLHASRLRRGLAIAPGVPSLRTGIEVAPDGTTLVDLRGRVGPALLAGIEALGGDVISSHPRQGTLRARVPLVLAEALAALPDVGAVQPADRAYTRKIDTSEGDAAHAADLLRQGLGVDGTSIGVGVLSDGVGSLASLQASGDLPVVTVLPGQAGSGSEGTAMLEIVHDLAPGAALLFATALGGQANFAANILALRAAGADILVDDVAYFAEAVFQDGVIADAVDHVTADGALYLSAAGNEGNLNDGTAGVWEGDYAFSGVTANGDDAHDFGGGQVTNQVILDPPFVFTLHWSDSQGGSGNDYDLLLIDPTLTFVVANSNDYQDGDDDPFEEISSQFFDDTDHHLVVVQFAGDDRFLHLNTIRGQLAIATAGQIHGHAAARGALAAAAVDVADAGGTAGRFDGSEPVEPFSSDGPRRVFYEADGTPITPGEFSSGGGELRAKPDLAGADGVSTATPGFAPFFGTSAAAPHAAAVAALLLERAQPLGLGPDAVRQALLESALDVEAPGVDRDSGAGIVDAWAAGTLLGELGIRVVPALGPLGGGVLALGLLAVGARAALRSGGRS